MNFVIEGIAESQYADEATANLFTAGQSYQDKADIPHKIFRNPDRSSVLRYLIVYTVKRGQPFLIVP